MWRPIETAPRDEVILLGAYYDSGLWDVVLGQWNGKRFPWCGQYQPTHWISLDALPPPPMTTAEGGE